MCKREYGELNKKKHGESEVKNAKEATCTEKGYTGDNCCKDCGEKVSSGKEIPLLGHTGGQTDCSKKDVCEVCKKEYGELNKSKHVETEVKNAKKATCTEKGYTGDNCCKGCGEKISSGTEIPALGHAGGEADCSKKAVCTVCKKEYGEVNKNKHGKSEVKNAKEVTCTEAGYTGDIFCKGCGEKVSEGTEIPAAGHVGGTANCTRKAVCDVCQKTYGELDKNNHAWNEGVVTKEATETEKGIKTYTCSTCQETKTEEIPATGKVVTPEKPGEVITPEIPETEVTLTPTPILTVTPKPTEKPSKEEPKKGTIVTDKKSNAKYKVLVAGKSGTVEYVKSLNKKSTKANIPATITINGITYKVVSIAKNAFKNNKFIAKVTIGKNVKTIGANAFYGCKKLKTISMGTNVTSIGNKAFYKCTALTKITIPSKVKKIGKQSFYGCKKLKTITLKTTKLTKKNVGRKAFTGINKKATIKVPKSKVKVYQKLLETKGISKTVKVKK